MAKIIAAENGTVIELIALKASGLFKEKGYTGTTVRDIAEAMGVEAPSLYNHIRSKHELLQKTCFKIARLFTTYIEQVQATDQPAKKKLDLIIRFHIRMMLEDYHSVYVSEHEWKHLREPYLAKFKEQRKRYRRTFANIIKRGIKSGELNDIDPSIAVLTLLSAVGGIEYWHRSSKAVSSASLEKNMVKILLLGIQK